MINKYEVYETNQMIAEENLDVRTITLGISLLDCIDADLDKLNENIYNKITTVAKDLVKTGEEIEQEFGIPIVNKRISITPVALIGGAACKSPEDFVTIAKTLDKAAKEVGVNFIGGYSALVSKSMTKSDENLIRSVPQALACTDRICSSINVGSTKTGINMDAVRLCGEIVKETAEATKESETDSVDGVDPIQWTLAVQATDSDIYLNGDKKVPAIEYEIWGEQAKDFVKKMESGLFIMQPDTELAGAVTLIPPVLPNVQTKTKGRNDGTIALPATLKNSKGQDVKVTSTIRDVHGNQVTNNALAPNTYIANFSAEGYPDAKVGFAVTDKP